MAANEEQPQIEPKPDDVPENTPEQIAAYEKNEALAIEELDYPIWQVTISGDEVPWEARQDPTYWHEEIGENGFGTGKWVPNAEEDLPAGARVEDGKIIRTAVAVVTCRAKNEQMAQMMALKHNPDFHTVDSVVDITDPRPTE